MQARCQCGAVQFTTPTPKPLAIYHCHCLECQKQSASAFGTSAIFAAFTPPGDAPIAQWARKCDSGLVMTCYFCAVCGTRLVHDRGTGTVSVKGGVLEGLEWEEAVHVWTRRAVVPIPEGVERYEEEPPSTA